MGVVCDLVGVVWVWCVTWWVWYMGVVCDLVGVCGV